MTLDYDTELVDNAMAKRYTPELPRRVAWFRAVSSSVSSGKGRSRWSRGVLYPSMVLVLAGALTALAVLTSAVSGQPLDWGDLATLLLALAVGLVVVAAGTAAWVVVLEQRTRSLITVYEAASARQRLAWSDLLDDMVRRLGPRNQDDLWSLIRVFASTEPGTLLRSVFAQGGST